MNRERLLALVIGLASALGLLASCATPPPSPVSTLAPPTPLPALPTATLILPTRTSVPPTAPPTANPFPNPILMIVGEEEVIFDWTTDRCEEENVPDLPTRAFRDAEGQVNMIVSHYVNYRAVGPDLSHLTMDCNAIMHSTKNADPALFSDWEWIGSTYTEDGQIIYALIHNEYQGHTHSGQCPQGEYFPCWYNTVTMAKSTDAGRSYTHIAEPPEHLVATLPYQYEAGEGSSGSRAPSNILKGKDGYYYSYLNVAEEHPSEQWVCLMRTDDLSDPKAWRFWDGVGFEGQFVNPYVAEGESHKCPPLEWDNIGASLNDSITYNTYLNRYVLIGISADWLEDREVWGVFYSFSDDLIHWSHRKLLLEMPLPWTVAHNTDTSHLYPSLLDPDSESRNFDTTDETAYLYFTRLNFGQGSLDRDLIRVPVEFFPDQDAVPPQSPPQGGTPAVEDQDTFEKAVGDWRATETDGTNMVMTITKLSEDSYSINFHHDGTIVCGEDANAKLYAADGVGVGTTTTNRLIVELALTCLTNPPSPSGVFTWALTYQSGSDTVTDNWGDSWQRAN